MKKACVQFAEMPEQKIAGKNKTCEVTATISNNVYIQKAN